MSKADILIFYYYSTVDFIKHFFNKFVNNNFGFGKFKMIKMYQNFLIHFECFDQNLSENLTD